MYVRIKNLGIQKRVKLSFEPIQTVCYMRTKVSKSKVLFKGVNPERYRVFKNALKIFHLM